jgi:hypothetical protein
MGPPGGAAAPRVKRRQSKMPERPGDIFTAAKPSEILGHAQILALQQMSSNLARLGTTVDQVAKDMGDVRERVARIEGSGMMTQLATMGQSLERACTRIDALESGSDKRSGVRDLVASFLKNMPWLVTMAMGALVYFAKR